MPTIGSRLSQQTSRPVQAPVDRAGPAVRGSLRVPGSESRMPVTSNVLVQDPVDALELSAAAAGAVGLSPPADGWHLYDLGAVNTLQADDEPDVAVAVSVHFTATDGQLPPGEDEQRPEGYALVCFVTPGSDPAADRLHHQDLAAALAPWLRHRSLRWCWQYDDEPWDTSPPGQAQPGQTD